MIPITKFISKFKMYATLDGIYPQDFVKILEPRSLQIIADYQHELKN